ncbi:MAG TPA: hypothetical protein VHG28_18430, partial [Longimicrobiaceae bacterium]|nr:hypothetical protein [Longimicrobiaceae bacterium]
MHPRPTRTAAAAGLPSSHAAISRDPARGAPAVRRSAPATRGPPSKTSVPAPVERAAPPGPR